nr:50S ribosomal protein L4 [Tsuneonella aeria]
MNDEVFGIEPRQDILHRVVTWQLWNRRMTARPTRERSDVARTGKKFGRQKGGGTARHGDRAAPVFIGGGKAHGARKRDFNISLNKKIRALGLRMALSSKAKDGLVIVDTLELADAKTKALKGHFDANGWSGGKVLVIDGDAVDTSFAKAAGNLHGINVMPAVGANVYDILKHDTLVLTKAAVEKLEARFNG